jgi:hypothetical protein
MGKPKQIEAIKNVILVVLFFSTMLLLYFFWENPMIESFNISRMIGEEEIVEAPTIQDVTRPEEIVVHFGGGIYTKLYEGEYDSWNQFILTCTQFGNDESLVVEEIVKEQYEKIMEFRSIQYEFQYGIPFNSLCSLYQITKVQSFDQIETASVLGFSAGSPDSLFVYDGRKDKYYRLVSAVQDSGLNNMISQIETGSYVTYYSIGTLVGTTNQNVLPLSIETNVGEVPYSPEFDIRREEGIIEFAQTFFGESLDFIRRIEESKGSIIYMYGYGEKILTINADGSIEYKEKMNSSGSQQDYFTSLEAALQFIASHGNWEAFDGNVVKPFVKSAKPIEKDKKKGYQLIFGMELDGEDIYFQNGESIVVEIYGDQVTYYTRNIINIDLDTLEQQRFSTNREAFSAVNMIAQNYQYIHLTLLNERYDLSAIEADALFEAVSNLIDSVEVGYMKPEFKMHTNNELVPVWIVKVADIVFYFDLYDAKPLGYTNTIAF